MGNLVDNKFTWVIKNVSSSDSDRLYSDHFEIGCCSWRVVAHSRDKNFKDCLSLSLIILTSSKSLDFGWSRYAKISFTLINQLSENLSQRIETMYDFRTPVLTCETMFSIGKLNERDDGFLVNGEIKIVVEFLEIFDQLLVSKESHQPKKKIKLYDAGEVSKDLIRETPLLIETVVVNGFQVLPSQVEFVKRIFEKHPDIASKFRPKNPIVKTAYINVLLSLIETLRQPPPEISKDDLVGAYGLLRSMKEAGFKLDWLEKKLNEVLEKKEKEETYGTRMREIEEEMKDLKEKVLDVAAPLSFSSRVWPCGRRYSASSSSIITQLPSVKSSPSPQIHLSQVQPFSSFDMSSKHQYTSCGENAIEEGMEKSLSPPLEDGLRVWFHSRT